MYLLLMVIMFTLVEETEEEGKTVFAVLCCVAFPACLNLRLTVKKYI